MLRLKGPIRGRVLRLMDVFTRSCWNASLALISEMIPDQKYINKKTKLIKDINHLGDPHFMDWIAQLVECLNIKPVLLKI